MSLEERERVEFSSRPIPASELARRMNEAVGTQDYKKISYRQITDWLVEVECSSCGKCGGYTASPSYR